MSYDDYVGHILRKYKLAVAYGIIKSKPKELKTEEYIKILQEKLQKQNNFDDISIQSDDFQFDETQSTNMNEHDFENDILTTRIAIDLQSNGNQNSNMEEDFSEKFPTNQKLVESVKSRIEQTDGPKNNKFIPESQTIDDDFTQIDKETAIYDQNIAKIDNSVENIATVSTYCDITKAGDTNKAMDSQATELYSIEDSHVSQSQDIGFSILDEFFLVRKRKPEDKVVTKNELSKKVCNNISEKSDDNCVENIEINKKDTATVVKNAVNIPKTYEKPKNIESVTKTELSMKVCDNINAENAQKNNEKLQTIENIRKTDLRITVCSKLTQKNNDTTLKTDKSTETLANTNNISFNINELKDTRTVKIQKNKKDDSQTPIDFVNKEIDFTTTPEIDEQQIKKTTTQETDKELHDKIQIDLVNKEIDFTTTQEIDKDLHDEIQNIIQTQEQYNTEDFNFSSSKDEQTDRTQSQEINDIFDSQKETVPFKIIEELNRVKLYLKRDKRTSNEGYSSDTGYHSGSQWSVKSSIQWLNQAAHTLVNYITDSPITTTTLDICNDISQVLGELVDKLHTEENYPQFMETILEYANGYLDQIYQDDEEEMELRKDEIIHRLIYLSQSVHIISYILEKITSKLEIIHTELISTENIYEISKIDETKNISYIFHILEILLHRYLSKKDSFNLKKINTQEKKVSISDIWRKKWNPSGIYGEKNELQVVEQEKQCILIKTSEILNKIIVNCMEMYSLISYAALQCFNVIQK